MYSLKVQGKADSVDNTADKLAEASIRQEDAQDASTSDALDFSAGNPRVEHVTGIIHLYRSIPKDREETPKSALPVCDVGTQPMPSSTTCVFNPVKHTQEGRSERLCVLAIPADMGVSDFCQFLGGYLPHVRHMRVVRRDRSKCVYSVLLRFDKLPSAEGFYMDYNGKPVCLMGVTVCTCCGQYVSHHHQSSPLPPRSIHPSSRK